MPSTRALFVSLSLCGLLAGCGDDDDGGAARTAYVSGVKPPTSTATVSTLDEGDKRRLCTSLDAHVQANVGFDAIAYAACLPAAIVLGGDQKGCEARLADCMDDFPDPVVVDAHLQDESVCFRDLDQCKATVSALETCVNVNLDLVFDILDNWSCAGANNAADRKAATNAMDTANVCADLNAACNNFATLTGPD
jgi:hypothetical protein